MSDEIQKAATRRAAALSDRDQRYLSALEVERNGYVVRGLAGRVADVDAEIQRITGTKPAAARKRV